MDKLFLEERYDFGEVFVEPPPGGTNQSTGLRQKSVNMDDLLVFFALESLGALAIVGNCCLVVVLMRNRYLQRASFVLMLSLALADILHGIVTTTFFYPPILLRRVVVPPIGVRIFNIIDWSAWSITLTHMSAICLDRLLAITLYGQYSQLITVRRAKLFTMTCWSAFLTLNIVYILARFCCLISPLAESHFYTFGYGEFESQSDRLQSPLWGSNLFKLTYTPLELCTLAVLSISNPITLIQLYRRHKRKMALKIRHSASTTKSAGGSEAMIRRHFSLPPLSGCCKNVPPKASARRTISHQPDQPKRITASTMLLEMSMRMGSKHVSTEVHEVATRRATRQQQRILFQISVVAIIFYLYMSAYYLLYHVFNVSNKWLVLFNSFFYSTTHMINPVIYFSLNKDMRAQLIRAIADCLNWACCVGDAAGLSRLGAMQSSIYGRSSKRTQPGGESSSGGSVLLRRSSYVGGCMTEANSFVQTENVKAGWTLRAYRPLPSAAARRAIGPLLSPSFSGVPTEHSAMLRISAVPQSQSQPMASFAFASPPSSALAPPPSMSSPFTRTSNNSRREQQQQQHRAGGAKRQQLLPRHQLDPNNTANDDGDEEERNERHRSQATLANLARTLAHTAGTMAADVAAAGGGDRVEHDDDDRAQDGEATATPTPVQPCSKLSVALGSCLDAADRRGSHDDGDGAQMGNNDDVIDSVTEADDNDDQDQMMLSDEQLELQLVDSWHTEERDDGGDAEQQQLRHQRQEDDTPAELLANGDNGPYGGRPPLGLFLAERLAHGLAHTERAAARAHSQRHSLLDALISALILSEDGGGDTNQTDRAAAKREPPGQDELQLNNLNNQLQRVCNDRQHRRNANKRNGLLLMDNNNDGRIMVADDDQQHGSADDEKHWWPTVEQKIGRKKSRSMDFLQQQQQQQQKQPQHGEAVQKPAATQQHHPNGHIPQRRTNSQFDNHLHQRNSSSSSCQQPMSAIVMSLSNFSSASSGAVRNGRRRRRRRSCELGTAYVPLREHKSDDNGDDGGDNGISSQMMSSGDEAGEEDVVFL